MVSLGYAGKTPLQKRRDLSQPSVVDGLVTATKKVPVDDPVIGLPFQISLAPGCKGSRLGQICSTDGRPQSIRGSPLMADLELVIEILSIRYRDREPLVQRQNFQIRKKQCRGKAF